MWHAVGLFILGTLEENFWTMKKTTYRQNEDWKAFYPFAGFVQKIERLVEEDWLVSGKDEIHLDIYRQKMPESQSTDKTRPVVVMCHGLSSCGRMMISYALELFKRGYHVICPDLAGFGLSPQKKGSRTIEELTQNLLDCVHYAKNNFGGKIYLTGISLGGSLSYYAACQKADDISAIACLNLMDLSSPDTLAATGRDKLIKKLSPFIKLAKKVFPNAVLPLKYFIRVENLSNDKHLIENFKKNPLVVKAYTYKAAYSLISAAPKIPFNQFKQVPILVMHGEKDKLLPESLTKKNYDQIAGEKKYLTIPNCTHVPLGVSVVNTYVGALDEWFRAH